MENNVLSKIAENIVRLRTSRGMTQAEVAAELGITFQAVSKWENGQSAPDIVLIPQLAELFHVTIDELFGNAPATPSAEPSDNVAPAEPLIVDNVPWNDDDVIRGVVYRGQSLLGVADYLVEKFVFVYDGAAANVEARCSLECGEVRGSAKAGTNIVCKDVGGSAHAGTYLRCGDVDGNATAGTSLHCGDVDENASAGTHIECGNIDGNARAGTSIRCGDIGGNAVAGMGVKRR